MNKSQDKRDAGKEKDRERGLSEKGGTDEPGQSNDTANKRGKKDGSVLGQINDD